MAEQSPVKERRPEQFDGKRLRLDGTSSLPGSFQPNAIVRAGSDSLLVGCTTQVSRKSRSRWPDAMIRSV
jgi:hypothetical protein